MTLAQVLKHEARRLGFTLAGITTPEPPPHWSVYENWLAVGRHGSMQYLAEERARRRRYDPRLSLPECRSILVLGARYPDPASVPVAPGLNGRVAAYAWGTDYHLVFPERLQALVTFMESQTGSPVPNRYYTDTGPLLERDLAQRAGLGWIGKNTCLINPHAGSYFLLAEILLGLELEPDAPFAEDRCGTCSRCIEACPTGCILPDRTIDARRCIAYLTIENKGEIPSGLRPKLGAWVFGCDLCQMVCPWNRKADRTVDPAFAPRSGVPHPDLAAELSLTAQEFNRKFKDSPVQRARRGGYLRNVAVALGNSGRDEALQAIESLRPDEVPLVREHAAWAAEELHKK